MLALISPAKIMRATATLDIAKQEYTKPRFASQTNYIISLMLRYSASELMTIFKISSPLARELKINFEKFVDNTEPTLAAVDSYDGVVYKHFKESIKGEDSQYLQAHVRISSLLFGLLRPLDQIKPYRMEGFARLAGEDIRVDRFWRDIQTQTLIDDTIKNGSTLLYLASKEEQNAFNWREVKKAIKVIDFNFLQHSAGKLRQVVIYTKMARGEMIRYMIENKITNPEELKCLEWGGYKYNDTLSDENKWVWLMD